MRLHSAEAELRCRQVLIDGKPTSETQDEAWRTLRRRCAWLPDLATGTPDAVQLDAIAELVGLIRRHSPST
jgi:hypothetical protein